MPGLVYCHLMYACLISGVWSHMPTQPQPTQPTSLWDVDVNSESLSSAYKTQLEQMKRVSYKRQLLLRKILSPILILIKFDYCPWIMEHSFLEHTKIFQIFEEPIFDCILYFILLIKYGSYLCWIPQFFIP